VKRNMTPTVPHLCLKKMVIVVDGGVFFFLTFFSNVFCLSSWKQNRCFLLGTKHSVPEVVYEDIQNFMNYAVKLA